MTQHAKLGCMTQSRLCEADIVIHIMKPRLEAIAKNLHGLFLESEKYVRHASASKLIEPLEMLA